MKGATIDFVQASSKAISRMHHPFVAHTERSSPAGGRYETTAESQSTLTASATNPTTRSTTHAATPFSSRLSQPMVWLCGPALNAHEASALPC